jgi:hypothetical protein
MGFFLAFSTPPPITRLCGLPNGKDSSKPGREEGNPWLPRWKERGPGSPKMVPHFTSLSGAQMAPWSEASMP